MSQIIIVDREQAESTAPGKPGLSMMEVIRDAGFEDDFACCGGNFSCATCHVYVDEQAMGLIPAMTAEESDLLDGSSHRRATSRLSCQVPYSDVLDGMKVEIAPAD